VRVPAAVNVSLRQTSIATFLEDDDPDLPYNDEARHVKMDDDLVKGGRKAVEVEVVVAVVAVEDSVRTKVDTRLLEAGLARPQKSSMPKWKTTGVRRRAVRMKVAPRRTRLPTKPALATPTVETWRWTRFYEIMITRNGLISHTVQESHRTFARSPGSRGLESLATSQTGFVRQHSLQTSNKKSRK
jgi:hypothetical protein